MRSHRKEVSTALTQLLSRMVRKRPQDRPKWGEILKILDQPNVTPAPPPMPSVAAAVEAALAKVRIRKKGAQAAENSRDSQRIIALYVNSCEALLDRFKPIVEQFNGSFQHGQITEHRDDHDGMHLRGATYKIPMGGSIRISFFAPKRTGIKLGLGEIIGGGWIGIVKGRSANLVLVSAGPDDLYGNWVVYEISVSGIVGRRGQNLIGRFGLTKDTVMPFGFSGSSDFYDQIQWARGWPHIQLSLHRSVEDYFASLIQSACEC